MSTNNKQNSLAEKARASVAKLQNAIKSPSIEELVKPIEDDLDLKGDYDLDGMYKAFDALAFGAALAHPSALGGLIHLHAYAQSILDELEIPTRPRSVSTEEPSKSKKKGPSPDVSTKGTSRSKQKEAHPCCSTDWQAEVNEASEELRELLHSGDERINEELRKGISSLPKARLSFPLKAHFDASLQPDTLFDSVSDLCDRLVETRISSERSRIIADFDSRPAQGFVWPQGWGTTARAPDGPLQLIRPIYLELEKERTRQLPAHEAKDWEAGGSAQHENGPPSLEERERWLRWARDFPARKDARDWFLLVRKLFWMDSLSPEEREEWLRAACNILARQEAKNRETQDSAQDEKVSPPVEDPEAWLRKARSFLSPHDAKDWETVVTLFNGKFPPSLERREAWLRAACNILIRQEAKNRETQDSAQDEKVPPPLEDPEAWLREARSLLPPHDAKDWEAMVAVFYGKCPPPLERREAWIRAARNLSPLQDTRACVRQWVDAAFLWVYCEAEGDLSSRTWNNSIMQRVKRIGSLEAGLKDFLRSGLETLAGVNCESRGS